MSNIPNDAVKAFYEAMPFNYHGTPEDAAEAVAGNPIEAYPDLDALLRDPGIATVLEAGCGAGWAANSMAFHYGKTVTAIDVSSAALMRANEVSRILGVTNRTRFIQNDLFGFAAGGRFDLVASIGVLHHTADCRRALRHISQFVAEEGFLFVGLYHLFGRRPFLAMFEEIIAQDGEEAAFTCFAALNPNRPDQLYLRSWFRDQLLHPRETQHTLEEVMTWLEEDGFDLISTSINAYGPVDDKQALIGSERDYEAHSRHRNRVEKSYFPGFFTVLAQRKSR